MHMTEPIAEDASSGVTPYVPPPPVGPRIRIATLSLQDPFRWLTRGLRDFRAYPGIALFYGLCFWAMAATLTAVFRFKPEYTMSIVSGCLLIGPFMAMGLYDVSRRREQGLVPSLGHSITCWDQRIKTLGMLLLVLLVLELLWGRASLVVFAVFFNTGMPSSSGVLEAVFNPQNWEFVLVYMAVGGVFAVLVFSFCVISMPMILDRDTDAISAAITSFRVVFGNTLVMLLWGFLIVVLLVTSMLPWGLGIVLTGPLLGHASWHAYRASVLWDDPPEPTGPAPAPVAEAG